MNIHYRLIGGETVPVEIVRSIRPLDSGTNAGHPRSMVRMLADVDTHNIHTGDIRPVLNRFIVREATGLMEALKRVIAVTEG